jgi:hypothetical protein
MNKTQTAALTGQRATFGAAVSTGFTSWGRMWWTRFLVGLALLCGFLLLVLWALEKIEIRF